MLCLLLLLLFYCASVNSCVLLLITSFMMIHAASEKFYTSLRVRVIIYLVYEQMKETRRPTCV